MESLPLKVMDFGLQRPTGPSYLWSPQDWTAQELSLEISYSKVMLGFYERLFSMGHYPHKLKICTECIIVRSVVHNNIN